MLFAFVNSLNWVPTNSFLGPQRPTWEDQNTGFIVQQCTSPPSRQHVAENDLGTIRRLNLKKIHTECFVKTESPWHRCWKPGLWRMSLGCACRALELSPHVVENLWPGTTETKSPQEFLARVPTIVMDILIDLPLARCQRFPDSCFTVATILIVKRRFVRHHLVRFVLLYLYRKRTSHVQVFQVRPRLCHSAFLWRLAVRFPNRYTRSSLVGEQPRVVMGEIGEVRSLASLAWWLPQAKCLHSKR